MPTIYRVRIPGRVVIPRDTGVETDLFWEGTSLKEAERQAQIELEEYSPGSAATAEIWAFSPRYPPVFPQDTSPDKWFRDGNRKKTYYRNKTGSGSRAKLGGSLAALPKKGRIPLATVKRALNRLGSKAAACGITPAALRKGMEIEREHRDVTRGGALKTAKIAAAHLCESGPQYYDALQKMERRLKRKK